jgi:hypothetical protein
MNAQAARLKEIHTILDSLTSSPYSHDVIELALATATSLPVCGQEHPAPVWLLIAGAPSSGKTEGVLLLKGAPNVIYLDAMTENSFVSGYVDKRTGEGPPQQLLTDLHGKCLIVKDLTTIFSMRDDRVKKILGDFQSIYDGEYAKATGTLGLKSYQSTFAMLGCITPLALHKHHTYMSMVGGRFLVIRLLPLTDQGRDAGFERAWAEEARRQQLPQLRNLLMEHVGSLLKEPVAMEPETPEQREKLNKLALLLARGRGVFLTEKVQELDEGTGEERYAYEAANVQIEEPYRALEQLKNLGRALARIHGRSQVTDHEMELLRRVVLSSVSPVRGDALACFRLYPTGLTAKELASELKKSETRARSLLQELGALKLVVEDKGSSGWIYRPIPELADLINEKVRVLDHRDDLTEEKPDAQNSPPTNLPIASEVPTPGGTFVCGPGAFQG